jgi:hypothetical protein
MAEALPQKLDCISRFSQEFGIAELSLLFYRAEDGVFNQLLTTDEDGDSRACSL